MPFSSGQSSLFALLGSALAVSACNALTGADDLVLGGGDGGGRSGSTGEQQGGASQGGASSNGASTSATQGSGGETQATSVTTGPAGSTTSSSGQGPACGDGTCTPDETCSSCPADCGACAPVCGDGTCNGGETCDNCASDCGACSQCQGASNATTALDADEQAFLVLINNYRSQNGLGPLAGCVSLHRAAQGHSEDMRDQNYFDHTGLDGSLPWDRACAACYQQGCGPTTAMAENIAAGQQNAQEVFTAWQNSPGHNANMLGADYVVIGIGKATGGGQYGVYWTNVFGGASEASCN